MNVEMMLSDSIEAFRSIKTHLSLSLHFYLPPGLEQLRQQFGSGLLN